MARITTRKPLSNGTRIRVFNRDSFTCQYCGATAPAVSLVVDHIIPVAHGGGNDWRNLTTACVPCNSGKHAQIIVPRARREEWDTMRVAGADEAEWHVCDPTMPAIVGIASEPLADPNDVKWLNEHCGGVPVEVC